MSEPKDGGPAFPVFPHQTQEPAPGMTLRDYFAAAALAADYTIPMDFESGARWAYQLADAMLAARDKKEVSEP